MTIGNLSANNITAGTLNVDRIGPNSVGVGKLSGSISSGDWKIDLTNGTLTIGTISANKITSGTIDASQITVTNLNASNITVGTLNGSRITDGTISGGKIGVGEITGGVDYYGRPTGNLAANSIKGGNIDNLTITGSKIADITLPGDKLEYHTLSDDQMEEHSLSTFSTDGGINKRLDYASFSDDVFNNRDIADYCHAKNVTVDSVLSADDRLFANRLFVPYGASYFEATWQQIALPTVTNKTLQVFNGDDQYIGYVARHYVVTDFNNVWVLKH